MAEILERFPEEYVNRRGRARKFKEEWFDGKARKLSWDEDLSQYCDINTARISLYKQGQKRGLKVNIAQHKGDLYFQVVSEEVSL